MIKKVLITDHAHILLQQGLEKAGFICDYQPEISYAKTLEIIPEYEGLIINSKILVDKNFIDKAPKLQFVARLGSGLEIIDLEYAKERQLQVFSSPEGNCDAVAEHALGFLLALAINLRQADAEMRQQVWNRETHRGWELGQKTVAIIGCGHTGGAFARKLKGLDMRILGYDKYKKDYNRSFPHLIETNMEQIWAEADIVSLHLPLTSETKYSVDNQWFERFSKNIILLNTARGQLIKTETLIQQLNSGKIRAAGLDVFENEKVATYNPTERQIYDDLCNRPNVLSTPHIAGWTHESKIKLAQLLLDKILSFFS